MLKTVYGVIVGFIMWSALWIGSDFLLLLLSPEWYGSGLKNPTTAILFLSLVRSVLISIVSGYATAFIAGRNSPLLAALALSILLFAFGVYVEAMNWNSTPLWYHLIFLILLIPAPLLGAKWRTR